MNRLLLLSILAAHSVCAQQLAQWDDNMNCLDGYIAFDVYPIGGSLFTLGAVNNDKAGFYLLDSGASISVIDDNEADKLGLVLDHYTGANVRTLESARTDVSDFCTGVIHHFTLADMDTLYTLHGPLDVLVTDISTLDDELPIRFSGILGLNFFQQYHVLIDFQAQKMYVKMK